MSSTHARTLRCPSPTSWGACWFRFRPKRRSDQGWTVAVRSLPAVAAVDASGRRSDFPLRPLSLCFYPHGSSGSVPHPECEATAGHLRGGPARSLSASPRSADGLLRLALQMWWTNLSQGSHRFDISSLTLIPQAHGSSNSSGRGHMSLVDLVGLGRSRRVGLCVGG